MRMKKKRTIRKKKKKKRKCQRSKKGTKISYEGLLLYILRQNKIEDADAEEDKGFLLSLLHSGSLTSNKFPGSNGNSQNIRHFVLSQNLDTFTTCSLPSCSYENIIPQNTKYFATKPINP